MRVAQSLGTFASFPPLVLTALVLFNVVHHTFGFTLGLVAVLLVFDGLGWRLVSALFDRERLVTGARS